MNTDIRISLDFPTHRKTLKLIRRLGDGAPWVLVRLWIYVARHLPDGVLTGMDEEDIEIAAGWQGDEGTFVRTLLDVGYLDRDENGTISCHDWLEHNPWVADANDRSDASRFSKLSQVSRAMFEDLQAAGVRGLSKRDYETAKRAALAGKSLADISDSLAIFSDAGRIAGDSIAPAPSPVPSPSPSPLPEPEKPSSSSSPPEEMPPQTREETPLTAMRMTTTDVRFLWNEAFGTLMPGGAERLAGALCREFPAPAIREAFHTAAVHGVMTLAYVEGVLRGNGKGKGSKARASPSGPVSFEKAKSNRTKEAVQEFVERRKRAECHETTSSSGPSSTDSPKPLGWSVPPSG